MSSDNYVEDEILVLPFLTDDKMTLGDLWDCNRSKKSPGRLFTGDITLDHIEEPIPINRDEKTLNTSKVLLINLT